VFSMAVIHDDNLFFEAVEQLWQEQPPNTTTDNLQPQWNARQLGEGTVGVTTGATHGPRCPCCDRRAGHSLNPHGRAADHCPRSLLHEVHCVCEPVAVRSSGRSKTSSGCTLLRYTFPARTTFTKTRDRLSLTGE